MARAEDAFSLVELLVVMAIMGIMAIIAIPNMADFLQQFRVSQSSNAVLSALRTARANSIKEFRQLRAVIDLDDNQIEFLICSGPGDCDSESDLSFEPYTNMQTLSLMDAVGFYAIRHATPHEGSSGWHTAKSGRHPVQFLPTGTKQFEAVVIGSNPPPAETVDNACMFNSIYLGATGQPRLVRSNDPNHTNTSYAAYGTSSPRDGASLLDHDFKTAPDCAK